MIQALDPNPSSPQLFGVQIDLKHHTVRLAGELDMATVSTLVDAATTLLDTGPSDITIDFTELAFIDSQGLNLLEAIKVEQDRRHVTLTLTGVSSRVRHVFIVAGLADLLAPIAPV